MKLKLTLSIFLMVQLVSAQITFEKWLGGSTSDDARGVIQLPDSGYAVLGRTWSFGNGGSDLQLIRLDMYGDTLWTKLYGGTSNEFTNGAIKMTPDSGFIIAGNTSSFGPGTPAGFNWYLIKTDANGVEEWTKTWGSTGNDELKHVLPTSDGNYLLTGAWQVSGMTRGIILKVDAAGNTLWGDTLLSSAISHFMYACENAQHEYIAAGFGFAVDYNAVIRKYDAVGNLLINKMYDYGKVEAAITVEPVPSGGYICSGTYGISMSYDPWILRLDENLDTLFTKVMDFTYSIAGWSAKEYSIYPSGNGFIICGADSNRLMLRKTDANLNTVWEELYGGVSGEGAYEGIPTSDGGYMAVGLTFSFGAGSADYYMVKTDSMGLQAIPVGISCNSSEDLVIYPNPFSNQITIKNIMDDNPRLLTIFDLQGREVFTKMLYGADETINLSSLANNIYILSLSDINIVRKMKLVKN
ncbi:MAG: T9SS type A sorting domain-containing protein [Bacteroidales bacterium]|nr:T9SS type A sorting domain-containing protein [Bacteroidales bacterium]